MSDQAQRAVGIIGGGDFGRSLAIASARVDNDVLLISRSARALPGRVHVSADYALLRECRLIFVAVPSEYVPALATELDAHLDGRHAMVHVSRGLTTDLKTLSQVIRARTACRQVGALAGPLVPESLATAKPGGAVIGTAFPAVADAVRSAIGGATLRVYSTDDIIGVEVASALVGVLSMALGVAQGLGVGPGALAMLATRGIAEAVRFGIDLGARPETFFGLAGFGDLVACVAGDGRAEHRLGLRLATGEDALIAEGRGANVEGLVIAGPLRDRARTRALDVPIISACAALVAGETDAEGALAALMARDVNRE